MPRKLASFNLNFDKLPDGRTLVVVSATTLDKAERDGRSGGWNETVVTEIVDTVTVTSAVAFVTNVLQTHMAEVPTDISIRVGLDHEDRTRIAVPK